MDPFLTTFGRTELSLEERTPPGLTSGRPLMLLVYLALNAGRTLERAFLADLLWGDDHGERDGRRALRQALYIVRGALPRGSIEADPQKVRLVGHVPSDAQQMEVALSAGDAPRVAALCRGRFLEGLIEGAPPAFAQWAEQQRTRYERRARDLLLRAAEEAAEGATPDSAVELLEAVDRIDGFDLKSKLREVHAWLRLGRTSRAADLARGALDHYDEIGLSLSPDARSRLETAASGAARGVEEPRVAPFPMAPQLAGRARERGELLAAWRRAVGGEGVIALVLGDPGIGKSRLISEVTTEARAEGACVLEGRSYALESRLLYGALIEVLRQSLDVPGFAGVGEVWLSELSRLLPELRERYPSLSPPDPREAGSRRRFYESVAQVFESLAYEQPVFCVLDDLHWADDATLELLHYLGRRLCARQVLFVAGIRPGEASPTLKRLQRALVRERGGALIELDALDESETRDLVSSMFGHRRLPTAVPALVWKSSEGNPFFAVSMVEALAERGCVSVTGAEVGWDEACARGVPRLPQRVKQLVGARLSNLSAEEEALLGAGAVAGRSFSSRVVAAITDRPLDAVERGMSSLTERRLVQRRRSDGESRWEFTHDRIREVVYEGLDEGVRTALHARLAVAEEGASPSLEPASAARHAALAGDSASAFRHALEAGRWARSVFAFEGARDMLRVALDNAPDDAARELIEAELASLPEPEWVPLPKRRGPVRRWRGWSAAAALVAVAGLAFSRFLAGHPSPPPSRGCRRASS